MHSSFTGDVKYSNLQHEFRNIFLWKRFSSYNDKNFHYITSVVVSIYLYTDWQKIILKNNENIIKYNPFVILFII